MNKQTAERISLWFLGAMLALPFLVPFHEKPIGSFYAEWLACLLGLAAFASLLIHRNHPLVWPFIAGLPILLTAILLLQMALGLLAYAETGQLAALVLIWAAMVMCTIATLRDRLGLRVVTEHLAFWLMAGALANAALGLLSMIPIQAFWIMPRSAHFVYGNLAQPNHYSHYLWLGICSAVFLHERGRLPKWPMYFVCGLLVCVAALAGSRAALAYATALWLVGLPWRTSVGLSHRLLIATGYFIAAFLLPQIAGWNEGATPGARLAADAASGGGIRPSLILVGWKMFEASPWLGAGFGSFGRISFELIGTIPDWTGAGEHAHNIVAQLLGELGLPAAAAMLALLGTWVYRLPRGEDGASTAWFAVIATIGLLHSLVEYPLWYSYFLGAFSMALALGDQRNHALGIRPSVARIPVAIGFLVCALTLMDFMRLQALNLPRSRVYADAAIAQEYTDALLRLRRGSLLTPYIDQLFVTAAAPTPNGVEAKRALCHRNIAFQPTTPAVFACAMIEDLAGNTSEARRLWHRADVAFPDEAQRYLKLVEDTFEEKDRNELTSFIAWARESESP